MAGDDAGAGWALAEQLPGLRQRQPQPLLLQGANPDPQGLLERQVTLFFFSEIFSMKTAVLILLSLSLMVLKWSSRGYCLMDFVSCQGECGEYLCLCLRMRGFGVDVSQLTL